MGLEWNRLFNPKNEPGRKNVEKAGKANLGLLQKAESELREDSVNRRRLNRDNLDLIEELQDPERGNLRVTKDERGKDVINCKYLGHEFEARTDENGYRIFLMDGGKQDYDDGHKLSDFRYILETYSALLKEQEHITERAQDTLANQYGGNLKSKLSAEQRDVAMKAIDDFLTRAKQD